VQPIRKPPTPTVNNQGKYRNLNKTQGRKIPAEPISNPPIAQRLTPFCRSRGGAKEPAGQCCRPMITHKEVNLPGALKSRTQGQTRPPRERSVTETNTNGSVCQGEVATVGLPETNPGGSACHPEATEAAGMKPLSHGLPVRYLLGYLWCSFLCYTVVMRDFLCKIYDQIVLFPWLRGYVTHIGI